MAFCRLADFGLPVFWKHLTFDIRSTPQNFTNLCPLQKSLKTYKLISMEMSLSFCVNVNAQQYFLEQNVEGFQTCLS